MNPEETNSRLRQVCSDSLAVGKLCAIQCDGNVGRNTGSVKRDPISCKPVSEARRCAGESVFNDRNSTLVVTFMVRYYKTEW